MAREGQRRSQTVTTCPASARCRRWAVRHTVSPSGTAGQPPGAGRGGRRGHCRAPAAGEVDHGQTLSHPTDTRQVCGRRWRSSAGGRRWLPGASLRRTVGATVDLLGRGQRRRRSPRGVAWKPASASAAASGWSDPSTDPPSAFSTVSRPRAPSRTASASASAAACSGARVVGEGQQRAATPLDVEHQLAVDQHDQRAGLAAGAVAGGLAPALGPGAARHRRGSPGRRRPAPPSGPVGRRPPPGCPGRPWWDGCGGRCRPPCRRAAAGSGPQPVDRAPSRTAPRRGPRRSSPGAPGRRPRTRPAPGRRRRTRRRTPSAATAPRVTTPCRSSSTSASAWARTVGVGLGRRAAGTSARRRRVARCGSASPAGRWQAAVRTARPASRPGRRTGCGRGADRRGRCAVRPPDSRARSGASVSPVTRPDQTRSHRACDVSALVVGRADGVGERAEEERAAAGQGVEHVAVERRSARARRRVGQGQAAPCRPGAARPSRRRRAGRRARDQSTSPPRSQLVQQRRAVAGDPAGQHQRLQRAGRQRRRRPAARPRAARPRCRAARPPTPCQCGRNRARSTAGTGSTSARSAASERRRSVRSTSASQ